MKIWESVIPFWNDGGPYAMFLAVQMAAIPGTISESVFSSAFLKYLLSFPESHLEDGMVLPDIRLLQAAIVLAEELHFSRTSERLNMTQSTLSKQIFKLEPRTWLSGLQTQSSSCRTHGSRAGVHRRSA